MNSDLTEFRFVKECSFAKIEQEKLLFLDYKFFCPITPFEEVLR